MNNANNAYGKNTEKVKKINRRIIRSNWKLFNNEILESLSSLDNISDLQLLLTVIASYYINGEELPQGRTSEFVVKFINSLFKWKLKLDKLPTKWYWQHLAYIKRHINVYYGIRTQWADVVKWNKHIKELLGFIGKKLYKTSFRKDIVSHNPWAKLSDKEFNRALQEGNNLILHQNASFVFPPTEYIQPLIDSLNLKLKNTEGVYKKAALIGSYVFLTHPFSDGNSRASRIMMISYLDSFWKQFIKLYTFLATFLKDLPSYDDFLQNEIYPLFDKIKDKVILKEEKNKAFIKKYPSIEEYEKLIEEATWKLEKRLIQISKYIYLNLDQINSILKIISYHSSLKGEEKIVSNYFLRNLFDTLKNDWLQWLINSENVYFLPDKFYKENKIESNLVEKVKLNYKSLLSMRQFLQHS